MSESNRKICVVGGGQWGRNHIKNLQEMGNLGGIVENDPQRLKTLLSEYIGMKGYACLKDSLSDGYDGYIVATPAETHFELGSVLLKAGKNVLIEKPFTLSSKDALSLIELSKKYDCRLMVGHLLLFHPAIKKMKEIIESGKIGRLLYIYSTRLNFGTIRTEENVFCSFAPHDLSVINFFIGKLPVSISAEGDCFLKDNIHDVVKAYLIYPGNIRAHIFVSWLYPFKEQRLVIVGDEGMLSYEDSSPEKKINFYSKKVEWEKGFPVKKEKPLECIEYDMSAPLRNELEYFVQHLDSSVSIADGWSGYETVASIEKVNNILSSKNIRSGGKEEGDKEYYAHESAYIDEGAVIGHGTKIWHFSHVMKSASIGENCSIGQNVCIADNVRIGNNVKIQNNVSVYEGVVLEDYVFCGPSMVFTNVKDPRCKYPQKGESHYLKTLIREGASIGANATIVCGHTVGRHAFIAAGAVVVSDVPDYALMMGVPAKRKGWMCECGEQLQKYLTCKRCGKCYQEYEGIFSEVKDNDTVY